MEELMKIEIEIKRREQEEKERMSQQAILALQAAGTGNSLS